MFNRKKPEPPKRRNRDLSQFGLFDISDDFDPSQGFNDNENDSDLEAELAAITAAGGGAEKKPKPKKIIPTADLDRMVADSLKDFGSDEELSGDDDDPDLLGELQEITGEPLESLPSSSPKASPEEDKESEQIFLPTTTTNVADIIRQRIEMYKNAEENAKTIGEAGKARRFNRGLKTLLDLLKQANAGKNINVDDIPPEVVVKKVEPPPDSPSEAESPQKISPTSPGRPAPPPPPAVRTPSSPPPVAVNTPSPVASPEPEPVPTKPIDPKLVTINTRKQEYKIAALAAKRAGDKASAIQYLQIIKQFDVVTKMIEDGQEVDLSDMPPPPEQLKEFLEKMQGGGGEKHQNEELPAAPQPVVAALEPEVPLSAPKNMLEALEQRLNKYKSVEENAKNEDNTSKARRFGRIVKQYEDAIKLHKRGKPFPIADLPVPPGFDPLPTDGSFGAPLTPAEVTPVSPVSPPTSKPDTPKSSPKESPTSPTRDGVIPIPQGSPKKSSPNKPELTTRISGNQVSTNLAERQMQILVERQKEFKIAAIEAKKAGEIEQAKEYLKIYKGFEGLLNAASSGLPVDLSTLPIPPSQRENLEDSFAIVTEAEVDPTDDISDISVRLEEQLAKQLMMCKNTRDHHRAMGDIAGMNRFENLALTVQKDLDLIRYARKKKVPPPKFHYEKRSFNIVHCNTDLTDNELEINVIRGITYNVQNAKDVDTYVKVEFPYPQDNFFNTRSSIIKNTDSPDYDEKYIVEIQRTNRQCQRLFKRQSAKFEIYSKGCCLGGICRKFPMCCFSGFFRSDILIGTVNVKLQQLETKCEIHDSYDLMDGRKTVGGKLEVKIRVRNPILTKQIEHIDEKWLILGSANN